MSCSKNVEHDVLRDISNLGLQDGSSALQPEASVVFKTFARRRKGTTARVVLNDDDEHNLAATPSEAPSTCPTILSSCYSLAEIDAEGTPSPPLRHWAALNRARRSSMLPAASLLLLQPGAAMAPYSKRVSKARLATYRQFVQEMASYYAEVDAFELTEEPVSPLRLKVHPRQQAAVQIEVGTEQQANHAAISETRTLTAAADGQIGACTESCSGPPDVTEAAEADAELFWEHEEPASGSVEAADAGPTGSTDATATITSAPDAPGLLPAAQLPQPAERMPRAGGRLRSSLLSLPPQLRSAKQSLGTATAVAGTGEPENGAAAALPSTPPAAGPAVAAVAASVAWLPRSVALRCTSPTEETVVAAESVSCLSDATAAQVDRTPINAMRGAEESNSTASAGPMLDTAPSPLSCRSSMPACTTKEASPAASEQEAVPGITDAAAVAQQLTAPIPSAAAAAATSHGSDIASAHALAPAASPLERLLSLCAQLPASCSGVDHGCSSSGSSASEAAAIPRMDTLLRQLGGVTGVVKLGEGTYGEAFKLPARGGGISSGGGVVIKIVPIEGEQWINNAPQKTAADALAEAAIALTLSGLSRVQEAAEAADQFVTSGFVATHRVAVCRGPYPPALVRAWKRWHGKHGSLNQEVDSLSTDQLYVVFAMEEGGRDLEAAQVTGFDQARSVLLQVALTLAVGEAACEFEHRDLHWGNVLLQPSSAARTSYSLGGVEFTAQTHGVRVTLIDFTASRLRTDAGDVAFCDLAQDPEIFQGPKNDCQADTYRRMRKLTADDWPGSYLQTNCMWMHYLADVLLYRKELGCNPFEKKQLQQFRRRAATYTSCGELITDELFRGLLSMAQA